MTGVLLPPVEMNLAKPGGPVVAQVISNELCLNGRSASFIRHLVLDVGGTALEGNFRAGQSFGVLAPGVDELGKPHKVRLYSVACPSWGEDGNARHLSTTPKRLIEEFAPQRDGDDPTDHHLFLGVCSNYLCDLKAGDEVRLTGPNGKRFLLPEEADAHQYLFLATGTGIAPFRGMVLELLTNPAGPCTRQIDLVMGAPYTGDLLYHDLFLRLAAEHPNFRYHTAISREGPGGRGPYVDALIEDRLDHFGPLLEDPGTLLYLCGLADMRTGIYRLLVRNTLAEGYLRVHPSLRKTPPAEWTSAEAHRGIKPTDRCMIEVY